MPQTVQIVPRYSFPYVETVVNNNTVQTDDDLGNVTSEPINRYLVVFASSKGIDNKIVEIDSLSQLNKTFGYSNFKKYGQAFMNAEALVSQQNVIINAMRIMAEDALASNSILIAHVKVDEASKKFFIKYTVDSVTAKELSDAGMEYTKENIIAYISKKYKESTDISSNTGYTLNVPVVAFISNGRGVYGNNYRWRISPNVNYEKNFGFKLYTFECLNVENGTVVDASYVGSIATTTKTNNASFINDVIEDADSDLIPMDIHVFEDNVESVYDKYSDLWKSATETADFTFADNEVTELPTLDCFDMFFGNGIAKMKERVTKVLPFIQFVQELTDDMTNEAPTLTITIYQAADGTYYDADGLYYDADGVADSSKNISTDVLATQIADGTLTQGTKEITNPNYQEYDSDLYESDDTIVVIEDITGNELTNGTDGAFGSDDSDAVKAAMNQTYINAFSGKYDKTILSPRRVASEALFDFNAPMDVKVAFAKLALFRNDCILYLDANEMDTLAEEDIITTNEKFKAIDELAETFEVLNSYEISYNLHDYKVKENSTGKRVTVTITYFLASIHPTHRRNFGYWIPMVNEYATLSGHVKDSLKPSIETHENELKEMLYQYRFNYFETVGPNTFVRSTQSTSVDEVSDLMEENNVNTLMELKRNVEADARSNHYKFTNASERQDFQNFIMEKYRYMIGTQLYSLSVKYDMNEFEFNRQIVHLYLAVKFRKLSKQTIVEIDVNKQVFGEDE